MTNQFTKEELLDLIQKATAGDRKSLETVMCSVQDLVFNLSLRMLGTFPECVKRWRISWWNTAANTDKGNAIAWIG